MGKRPQRRTPQPDPLADLKARLNAAATRAEARLLEHASSAYVLVCHQDGEAIDPLCRRMGSLVECVALEDAMAQWLETDSGIIVDETDDRRREAVTRACRELGGLAAHGLILVPACEDGTSVYAQHWGSELIVHQTVKALAKRKKR